MPAMHLNDLLNNETPLLLTSMHFITNQGSESQHRLCESSCMNILHLKTEVRENDLLSPEPPAKGIHS